MENHICIEHSQDNSRLPYALLKNVENFNTQALLVLTFPVFHIHTPISYIWRVFVLVECIVCKCSSVSVLPSVTTMPRWTWSMVPPSLIPAMSSLDKWVQIGRGFTAPDNLDLFQKVVKVSENSRYSARLFTAQVRHTALLIWQVITNANAALGPFQCHSDSDSDSIWYGRCYGGHSALPTREEGFCLGDLILRPDSTVLSAPLPPDSNEWSSGKIGGETAEIFEVGGKVV